MLPATAMFFLISSLAGVLVGTGLIARSPAVFRLFDTLNRYVSTRRSLKVVSMPHDIGRNVHRHRLWVGPLFILGASYSIYGLGARFDNDDIVSALALDYPQALVAWLLESVRW
ncbi:MAG: hypothetical protein Q8K85_12475 [Hyphomicrobium sp.]|nr:hypothetical protein [Hyphomicrobium sp.]